MKSNINNSPLRTYTDSQFPTVWTDEKGITIHGYQNRTDLHYGHGWREYVAPVIDPVTYKQGGLYFDQPNDVVTNYVLEKTQEEKDQYQQALLDADESAQKRQRESTDGRTMFEQFLIYIQRRFDKGEITGNQALSAMTMLYTPLLPLKDGMFKFAQANLNAITPPANQILLDMLNLAKQKVANYIAENP